MRTLPVEMLGDIWIFTNLQLIGIVVLIGLIIFYFQYRKKQM